MCYIITKFCHADPPNSVNRQLSTVNSLHRRLLLAKAMKTSEPPDNVGRIDSNYRSFGKSFLNDSQRFFILSRTKSGNYHEAVGDIEISIRSRQTLTLPDNLVRHRQFHDI